MNTPPAIQAGNADKSRLRLLSVVHFIFGFLLAAFGGFTFIVVSRLAATLDRIETDPLLRSDPQEVKDTAFLHSYGSLLSVFAAMALAWSVANLLSGLFIKRKKNRLFSLVVAGADCLLFPIGTAIGILAFIVLLRPSVRAAYPADSKRPGSFP